MRYLPSVEAIGSIMQFAQSIVGVTSGGQRWTLSLLAVIQFVLKAKQAKISCGTHPNPILCHALSDVDTLRTYLYY